MLPQAAPSWTIEEAAHLSNRAGFGGSPAEIRDLHALGRRQAVEKLLAAREEESEPPGWAQEPLAGELRRQRFERLRQMQQELAGRQSEEAERRRREFRQQVAREEGRQLFEARDWWFQRMLRGKAPLREKMTLFWHDHFATSARKVRDPLLLLRQNELFRSHALGDFRELTRLVTRDPAMILYLDAQNSRKGRPNENLARELMELFTLGEGHYSERDIREAARALTGLECKRLTGEVFHRRRHWDEGRKTILGQSGNFDGDDVVRLVFEQPQAARFMARKLWEFFAAEDPPAAAIEALAATLRGADYEIAPLLREIFLSREFYAAHVMRGQIKCPVQYVVQMLKELEIADPPAGFAAVAQHQLGQALFMPPNVAGWDWGRAWINTNTLLARYNLAGYLTQGARDGRLTMRADGMDGSGMATAAARRGKAWQGPDYWKIAPRPLRADPAALVDALGQRFFHGPVPDKARRSFIDYAKTKQGVVFTDREVAELCHLMLSTPYYQLC